MVRCVMFCCCAGKPSASCRVGCDELDIQRAANPCVLNES